MCKPVVPVHPVLPRCRVDLGDLLVIRGQGAYCPCRIGRTRGDPCVPVADAPPPGR